MKQGITALLVIAALCSCESVKNQESVTMSKPNDPHSYAIPDDARVKHLNWKAQIDFNSKTIHAVASWTIESDSDADRIMFDTKDLSIEKITLDDNADTEFQLSEKDPILGQALVVKIKRGTQTVHIEYSTTQDAEALQWLEPQQTLGKTQPFLFTQSQAILARSWVPCQDSPGIRFTYEAEVTGPKGMMILMSAANPQRPDASGTYHFKMDQAIPSYLLALTAGDLSFQAISDRSGVYAEAAQLKAAAWEFEDLEKMIKGAEELYGLYQWDRYDVIVLPPSFPFGGMENPRLTFATPTILAGDRSLTSLIAHELAHSWSGNLVTNGTWNDFWLNEGFTVYFEHRIMEKLYGADYSEMLASLALQELKETIEDLKKDSLYADTKLLLSLEGRSPDDGVTDIAYNKGYFFLRSIEEKYGRETFDRFVKDYFAANAFHSMTTDKFVDFIKQYYQKQYNVNLPDALFTQWIYSEGLPTDCPVPNPTRFTRVQEVVATWQKSGKLSSAETKAWSTHEWLHFLKNLPASLSTTQLAALDQHGNFTTSGNAEILAQWFIITIRNRYTTADKKLEEFLIKTGRRKFLTPLYTELIKTHEGKKRALEIYQKARPNYHFVATNTMDKLLK
jgi:leukotriene A-4 hydrolase/aminopeptidase